MVQLQQVLRKARTTVKLQGSLTLRVREILLALAIHTVNPVN